MLQAKDDEEEQEQTTESTPQTSSSNSEPIQNPTPVTSQTPPVASTEKEKRKRAPLSQKQLDCLEEGRKKRNQTIKDKKIEEAKKLLADSKMNEKTPPAATPMEIEKAKPPVIANPKDLPKAPAQKKQKKIPEPEPEPEEESESEEEEESEEESESEEEVPQPPRSKGLKRTDTRRTPQSRAPNAPARPPAPRYPPVPQYKINWV